MNVFVPYSGLHVLVLAVCALTISAPARLGCALCKDWKVWLGRALAAVAVAYWLAYNIWWNWRGIDLRTGLPLQICDFNGLMAPLALLTGWRWARATLYFWTAALTLQAFLQPALTAGPSSLVFWAFWAAHTMIATCAVYDIAVLGFRPSWRDLGHALIVTAVYGLLVLPVDLRLGADYGFVGNPPVDMKIPPFVAALGPWPLRAAILGAMVPLGSVVVLLPWRIVMKRSTSRSCGAYNPQRDATDTDRPSLS
jgi:hypothetical integral membrane protein (TIGR02206 family)